MAGRPCICCTHPFRAAIDKRLASNDSVRSIAKEFNIPKSTIANHKIRCTGLKTLTPEERREPTKGTIALATLPSREQLGDMYADLGKRIDDIAKAAQEKGSLLIAIQGLGQLRQTLDSISKLAGHTTPKAPQVQVNVAIDAGSIAASLIEAITSKGNNLKTIEANPLKLRPWKGSPEERVRAVLASLPPEARSAAKEALRIVLFKQSPECWARLKLGTTLDDWQRKLVSTPPGRQVIALTARQRGKTEAASIAIAMR